MRIKAPKRWYEVSDTASISFGPVQLYCFRHPNGSGYKFKIGSEVSDRTYKSLARAKNSGLRYLENLGKALLEGVRNMPEYEMEVVIKKEKEEKEEAKLDAWHVSILDLGK